MNPYSPQPFGFKPTRSTQPYRNNAPRQPGPALNSMLGGKPLTGPNPMDVQRQFQAGMAVPKEGSLGWHLLRLQQFYSSQR